MKTMLSRSKTAARCLLLMMILGYSAEGVSQIDFELREEEPRGPGNIHLVKSHSADFDGDGDVDFLIAGTRRVGSQKYITELYLNPGNGEVILTPDPFMDCNSAAIADVDGDQDQDVLISGQCLGDIPKSLLYLNDGSGNFTPVFEDQFPGLRLSTVEFFHYDSDGLPDLFMAGQFPDIFSKLATVYRNEGNGRFKEIPQPGISPLLTSVSVELGDIDNDGDSDLIYSGKRDLYYRGTFIYLNNSGAFSGPKKLNDLIEGDLKLRDLNLDGFLDLLVIGWDSNSKYGTVYYLNDGEGNFVPAPEQVFFTASFPSIEVHDFDGDEDPDIFIGGREGVDINGIRNGNALYLNDGSGNFTLTNELENFGTGGMAIGNFDGQSYEDIIIFGNTVYNTGPIKHLVYLNRTVVDQVPSASDLLVSGELLVGNELTGSYTFHDPEGETDKSIFKWYRAADLSGTEFAEIDGANSSTYTPVEADSESFLSFEVIPFDGAKTGEAVKSQWLGPIKIPMPEIAVMGNNQVIETGGPASSENHTDFGSVSRGEGIRRVFSIVNQGKAELIVSSISISGMNASDFSLEGPANLHIVPNDSENFSVLFSPSDYGARAAEISIESNAGEAGAFRFSVTGEGLNSAPEITSPSEVSVAENTTETVIDINATNGDGGTEDLEVRYSITGGADKELFVIDPEYGHLKFQASPDFEMPGDLDEDNIYKVVITANDGQSENNLTYQEIAITVTNIDEPPIAACVGNFTLILDGNGSASLSAEDINEDSTDDMGIATIRVTPESFSCSDEGSNVVVLEVTDSGGNTSTCTTTVNVVDNQKPQVTGVSTIYAGSGPGGCDAFIDIISPTVIDNCTGAVLTGIRQDGLELVDPFPIGETEIVWTAAIGENVVSEPFVQLVIVDNNAPDNISFSGPEGPQEIGTAISMQARFNDENIATAIWKAYNGNQVVQEHSAAATGSETSHVFEDLPAGVYTMILELRDHCGKSATAYSDYVVLYDPNGGFVTGGGWFHSPPGALSGSEAVGKAHFGFNAKYKNGKNDIAGDVGGDTNFQFKAGDLDFKSSSHERMSLVVSGGFKATYKGKGTVNGVGDYQFMLTVIDAEETANYSTDLFRIKIWNDQGVLYDNMLHAEDNADPTTVIGGGSIVIHKPKGENSKAAVAFDQKDLTEEPEVFMAYPNPVEGSTIISFKLNRATGVLLNLFDLNGREVSRLFEGEVLQGLEYQTEVKDQNLMKGVYIIRLVLDTGEVYQKQLLVN